MKVGRAGSALCAAGVITQEGQVCLTSVPHPPQEQAVAAGRKTQDQARGAAPNTDGQRERDIRPLAHISEKYLQFFTLKHPAFFINTDNSQTGDSQLTQTQYY